MKIKVNKKQWKACPICGGLPLLAEAGDGLEVAYCNGGVDHAHADVCTPIEPVGTSRLAWNDLVDLIEGVKKKSDLVKVGKVANDGGKLGFESSFFRVVPMEVYPIPGDFCMVDCKLVDAVEGMTSSMRVKMVRLMVGNNVRMYREHVLELCGGIVLDIRVIDAKDGEDDHEGV